MSIDKAFFEIYSLVECPDCKRRWFDWIVYEPDLPNIIERQCYECRMLDNFKNLNKKQESDYSQLYE